MDKNKIWKTWVEVKQACRDKKIIIFGKSGDWVPKTTPFLPQKGAYIVDNNLQELGNSLQGLLVYSPEKLLKEDKKSIYIIISTGSYEGVVEQLTETGFVPGEHFCVAPVINDLKLLQEIRDYKQKVIISSSDFGEKGHKRYSKKGGGIYVYDIYENDYKKVVHGHFRQMEKGDNCIYAIEYTENMVYVLSNELKIIGKFPLGYANACGAAFCPERNILFIANADDEICVHDVKDFKVLEKIEFSDKHKYLGKGSHHHINDLCVVDGSLYVSYFSKSGNWRKEVHDGGIDEFLISDLNRPSSTLVHDLWMPHSPKYINGALCYLESMRGKFYTGNKKIGGEFPGFIRGLAYDNRFYYIGQSETIYMSRLFGISNNIMLNAGFYLFDLDTKVSKFYPCQGLTNVHDLLVLS